MQQPHGRGAGAVIDGFRRRASEGGKLPGYRKARETLPWHLFLGSLLALLVWQALGASVQSAFLPGVAVLCAAAVRMFLALRMEDSRQARHAMTTGAVGLILGLVFFVGRHLSPLFLERAILGWIAISLLLSLRTGRSFPIRFVPIAFPVVVGAVLLLSHQRWLMPVVIGIAVYELMTTAFMLAIADWRPADISLRNALGNSTNSELSARYAESVAATEPYVRQVGHAWTAVIVLSLLGAHLGRMGFNGNLGVLPALIALAADLALAVVLAFLVVLPFRASMARLLGRHEDQLIRAMARSASHPILARLARLAYTRHILLKIRLTEARSSLPASLRQGLVTGLPLMVVLTAVVPILGTNWFFNTEEWASVARDQWSARNADQWRMDMVAAANRGKDRSLRVSLPGLGDGDFSFVVVGDPGQGGLSQIELAKRIVRTSDQEDVKFVLVSSDVVYPNGEMQDYEARFWSPFSGLSKPILAIPGNHDWYDGLDAFAATFFTKDAAGAAISSRINDGRADRLIEAAAKLRKSYGLTTQLQTAPYFKVEAGEFVLLCLDTGVVARVDEMQMEWFRRALEDARGKTVMVLLGHPLFGWNRDRTLELPGLVPILDLLRKEKVSIVMAGDIHGLEYYRDASNPDHPLHHFVNGGGGAYISIDRALGSPKKPIVEQWAYHPSRDAIVAKLDEDLPPLLRPIWWMARNWEGRVWAGDRFSTALDQDKSPFLNSFLVVHVEPSGRQIRIAPHGVHGRLKWSELALPADREASPQEYAEWLIPMSGAGVIPAGSPRPRE